MVFIDRPYKPFVTMIDYMRNDYIMPKFDNSYDQNMFNLEL